MSDERRYWFVIDKGKLEYVQDNVTNEKITVSELEDLLNEQQNKITELEEELEKSSAFIIEQRKENKTLKEENERLRNQLERKTILLKIRTKHIDDREKSFHELLNYLESFCYKSNIDGNYAKQDIINILNNWEIMEYD